MADSYVVSTATIRCSFGTNTAKLMVYPDRTVFMTGKPMGNISDHTPLFNIFPFGRCKTTSFPATGAATAAAHGKLTPMPCIPCTMSPWMNGKNDVIVKGQPALLKSSYCQCQWGGIITITENGQGGVGCMDVMKQPKNDQSPAEFIHVHRPQMTDLRKIARAKIAKSYISKDIDKNTFQKNLQMIGVSFSEAEECWRELRRQRRHMAVQFYSEQARKKAGKTEAEWHISPDMWNMIRSSVNGIDFDHSVEAGKIPPPEELLRYILPNEEGGSYAFEESDPMPSPEELGMLPYQLDLNNGEILIKTLAKFTIDTGDKKKYYDCLRSTARGVMAPQNGNWKDHSAGNMKQTCGGAKQIYIPLGIHSIAKKT